MEEGIKFFVGLDVHKDTIAVAAAEAGREPARWVGTIAHDVGRPMQKASGRSVPHGIASLRLLHRD